MSIWDYFNGNASPEQSAGLLGLASAFNGALGDGSRPVNFGAALAAGAQGMQQGRQQHVDRQQLQAMQALKMRAAQGEVEDQERTRTEQNAIQNVMRTTQDPAAMIAQIRTINPMKAAEIEKALMKAEPEYDTTPRMFDTPDGPVAVQLSKTALPRVLQGFKPRDELEFRDGGGVVYGLDKYSGDVKKKLGKTMTLAEIAADRRAAERMAMDRAQVGKPTFSAEAGGFVLPPSAVNPTGRVIAPEGFKPKVPAAPAEFSKSAAGLVELENSLANYEAVIKEIGGTRKLPSSEKSAKLAAAFTGVQMGLKNAMELGALAGPDVEILGGMLVDPTSGKGLMLGSKGVTQQIAQTRKYLGGRKDAVEKVYGRPVPKGAGAQPPKERTVTRTGMSGGRKVVQYSDGSVEYAD